jgi:hypothetical protein
MGSPAARQPVSLKPGHLNGPSGTGATEVSDNVGSGAWKLALMAAAVLAAMGAITAALVYVGPIIGL